MSKIHAESVLVNEFYLALCPAVLHWIVCFVDFQ